MSENYKDGYSFPKSVIFDLERMKRLFNKKWFFVGTRGDVSSKGSFLNFQLFNESYFILHGLDGKIRAFVNRCAQQSARLVNDKSKIIITNLDPSKRPISAVADNLEVRNAKSITVKTNNKIKFNLLYDKNRSLQKKIKIEQIRKETT